MARVGDRLRFPAALAAMGGALLLSWWLFFGRGPGADLPSHAPAAVAPRLEVLRAAGGAWVTRGGAGRQPLAAGVALAAADVIETGPGGVVELGAGSSYQVLLEGGARVAVKEIAAELSRFRLDEGLAEARVAGDPARAVVIESAGDASVRTRGGRVAVAVGGGRVAVGVREGEAQFASGGQIVAVKAGQSSIAEAGGPPSEPAPMPKSLLLKVDWPAARVTNQRKLVVRGRTNPGALVTVGGERVRVGPDGAFTHILYLKEGQQSLEASALDVAGRREAARSQPVVLDTRAPSTEFDTEGLWGRGRGRTTSTAK